MLLTLLGKHPFIGGIGSVFSGFLGLIQILTPVLSFITVLLGLIIGYLTLRIKIIDLKKKSNDNSEIQ